MSFDGIHKNYIHRIKENRLKWCGALLLNVNDPAVNFVNYIYSIYIIWNIHGNNVSHGVKQTVI